MPKKPAPKAPKMGRPAIEIDLDQLKAFMRLKPTREDTAAFFGCSVDTIERVIKREFGQTFAAFRDQNMVHTRFRLVREAIRRGEGGSDTMLIFCLKNLCGWSDKQDVDHSSGGKPFQLNYKVD